MARYADSKKANHFHTVCLKGKKQRPIAVIEEALNLSSESEEQRYTIEHVRTVIHNKRASILFH